MEWLRKRYKLREWKWILNCIVLIIGLEEDQGVSCKKHNLFGLDL
jgi:hypothetical protein